MKKEGEQRKMTKQWFAFVLWALIGIGTICLSVYERNQEKRRSVAFKVDLLLYICVWAMLCITLLNNALGGG